MNNFICVKAYDVLSEGRYRRFLVHSREIGEPWAMEAQVSVNKVLTAVKNLIGKIYELDKSSSIIVSTICKNVIASSSPPTYVCCGLFRCCITGVLVHGCVDTAKCEEQKNDESHIQTKRSDHSPPPHGTACVTSPSTTSACFDQLSEHAAPIGNTVCGSLVHPTFAHFFLMLWYVCRIEHIVKNHARCWLEELTNANRYHFPVDHDACASLGPLSTTTTKKRAVGQSHHDHRAKQRTSFNSIAAQSHRPKQHRKKFTSPTTLPSSQSQNTSPNVQKLCQKFSECTDFMHGVHGIFVHGVAHVCESINALNSHTFTTMPV